MPYDDVPHHGAGRTGRYDFQPANQLHSNLRIRPHRRYNFRCSFQSRLELYQRSLYSLCQVATLNLSVTSYPKSHMDRLTIFPTSINERHIETAVEALRDGEIVIYPTDSLYALGCNALSQRAVERLCAAKGINPDKQLLSVVCADLSMAAQYARIDNRAFQILKRNTPGAFTFVLPAATTLPKAFKGRKTVGIRIPDNAIARAISLSLDGPSFRLRFRLKMRKIRPFAPTRSSSSLPLEHTS